MSFRIACFATRTLCGGIAITLSPELGASWGLSLSRGRGAKEDEIHILANGKRWVCFRKDKGAKRI